MTTETILTDGQIEHGRHNTFSTNNPFCPCDSKTMRKAARWAEKAVLQSPEVQVWKRDAELFQFLLEEAWFQRAFDRFDPDDGGSQVGFETECRRILSAAMEQ